MSAQRRTVRGCATERFCSGKITCRHGVMSTTTPWAALSTVTPTLDHPPPTHLGAN